MEMNLSRLSQIYYMSESENRKKCSTLGLIFDRKIHFRQASMKFCGNHPSHHHSLSAPWSIHKTHDERLQVHCCPFDNVITKSKHNKKPWLLLYNVMSITQSSWMSAKRRRGCFEESVSEAGCQGKKILCAPRSLHRIFVSLTSFG